MTRLLPILLLLLAGCNLSGTRDYVPLPHGTVNPNDFSPLSGRSGEVRLKLPPNVGLVAELPPVPQAALRAAAAVVPAPAPKNKLTPIRYPAVSLSPSNAAVKFENQGYWAIQCSNDGGRTWGCFTDYRSCAGPPAGDLVRNSRQPWTGPDLRGGMTNFYPANQLEVRGLWHKEYWP